LLLYTQALPAQMSKIAVCNRPHSVERQLCRWLLPSHDRLDPNELFKTQALIANMQGLRREAVPVAAHRLQHGGLIRYKRGHITIIDRRSPESKVCECYEVVRAERDRLLAYQPNPSRPHS
jgi:CRP-like cAMP-binding protein